MRLVTIRLSLPKPREAFDFTLHLSTNPKLIRGLANGRCIQARDLLLEPPRVRKTHSPVPLRLEASGLRTPRCSLPREQLDASSEAASCGLKSGILRKTRWN